MIYEVEGDILLSESKMIGHGIAPNDDFKKGLAMGLRERWPALYKDFRHFCRSKHPKPGEIWVWRGVGGAHIVNLFTQEGAYDKGARPGRATVHSVHTCLKKLKEEALRENLDSIALPRIATGVGGLEWEEVRPLIEEEFKDTDIRVFIYSKYVAKQKAEEK